MARNSYGGQQIYREPPCVTQGAGDCPGGISPPETPLAKFAQQELPYPWGHCLLHDVQQPAFSSWQQPAWPCG